MAQDTFIYNAVCKVHGHDIFVLSPGHAPAVLICKRCAYECRLEQTAPHS